jgi:hypothetical protein
MLYGAEHDSAVFRGAKKRDPGPLWHFADPIVSVCSTSPRHLWTRVVLIICLVFKTKKHFLKKAAKLDSRPSFRLYCRRTSVAVFLPRIHNRKVVVSGKE